MNKLIEFSNTDLFKKWARRITLGLRRCVRCKNIFVLNNNNFPYNRSRSGGFEYYCKKCACDRATERRKKLCHTETWKEHVRKRDKEYRKNNGSTTYRRIIKRETGVSLTPEQTVHHIDGNNKNNNLENLYIFSTRAGHNLYEANVKETYYRWVRSKYVK